MTSTQIIEHIARDRRYKDYCKALCKGADIWNDLYQEFLMALLSKPPEVIEKIYQDEAMHKYSISVICNYNKRRFKEVARITPGYMSLCADYHFGEEALRNHVCEEQAEIDLEKHIDTSSSVYEKTIERIRSGKRSWDKFKDFKIFKAQTHERFNQLAKG